MFRRDAADSAQGHDMAVSRNESMKEPNTAEEVRALHTILRTDPQRYLRLVNKWIDINPRNAHAFWERHLGWMKVGKPHRALEDLNKAIELDPEPVAFRSRGEVYRHLGEYEKALADFSRGEALDPKQWENDAFGVYYQADVHARLGNEPAALACCARLPDGFWTPGIHGAPAGGKAEIVDELRRIAAEARCKSR
jgi:tetratricopeptide (TPR) repeat protein